MKYKWLMAFCLLGVLFTGCRQGNEVINDDEQTVENHQLSDIVGLYILNEGQWQSNKCSLDYLDLSQNPSTYHRNIYPTRNPQRIKELGDLGNDIIEAQNKLWIMVNGSNKMEVLTADSAKYIRDIFIPNGRRMVFDDRYVYVSSYAGVQKNGSVSQEGQVYKIDMETLEKVDSVMVGMQPEGMAITNNILYVANSGGYHLPDYDNRLMGIDLKTFKIVSTEVLDINIYHCVADKYGQLWITSLGNYADKPAKLYCVKPDSNGKIAAQQSWDIPVSNFTIAGDTLYYIASVYQQDGTSVSSYGTIQVKNKQVLTNKLFESEEIKDIRTPYCILVNPATKDFYITDAKDFSSSGELLGFDKEGHFMWRFVTGDIPGHGVFIRKKKDQ